MDLDRLWRLGWATLEDLRTSRGFNASELGSGLYAALFGRDSLWILLFLLEIGRTRPDVHGRVRDAGHSILETLAQLQGVRTHDPTEEQPGKIVHEHWDIEPDPPGMHVLPLLNGSTYCGFDQTFLFVIAVRRYFNQFPDTPLRSTLVAAARAAIGWMRADALAPETGLYAHRRRYPGNPIHQVWKDSFDAITHVGFDVPDPPVAWIDVQGYAYRALLDAADLAPELGLETGTADELLTEAARLQTRVEAAFWIEDEGSYAVAVDGQGRAVRMMTSNPGHALWGGLPTGDRARAVAARLVRPDLTTRYGLRTLSELDRFFAPHEYHRGTIWPFDNAVVAWGLIRYGLDEAALSIVRGVLEGLSLVGSAIELYVVVPSASLISPAISGAEDPDLLFHRRVPPQNRSQGFSAAGLLYCVSELALRDEVELSDLAGDRWR